MSDDTRGWYGKAAMLAADHKPERVGCTCGFSVWSVEHVAVSVGIELRRVADREQAQLRAERDEAVADLAELRSWRSERSERMERRTRVAESSVAALEQLRADKEAVEGLWAAASGDRSNQSNRARKAEARVAALVQQLAAVREGVAALKIEPGDTAPDPGWNAALAAVRVVMQLTVRSAALSSVSDPDTGKDG